MKKSKELLRIPLDWKTLLKSVSTKNGGEEDILLTFNNGDTIHLEVHTDGNCCAMAYLDTAQLVRELQLKLNKNIDFIVKSVPDIGVIVEIGDMNRVLVPCYESNNGYYSTDAELTITHTHDGKDTVTKIDFKEEGLYENT